MAETAFLTGPPLTRPGSLITRDGQIQWAGLLMGPGTPYQIDRSGVTGWEDLPALDTGDIARPDQHGAWPGARWAQPRIVEASVWLLPSTAGLSAHDVTAGFRAATGAEGGEQWLTVRLHGEALALKARVSRRVVPNDRSFARDGTARATVQWTATDPRRYSVEEHSEGARLPRTEDGLVWQDERGLGLAFPLDWGSTGGAGAFTVLNAGSAATRPVIEFRGPLRRPALTRLSDGRRLQYDIALGPQDVLTVDTETGTVLLNGTASRLYTATSASSPEQLFHLEPGRTPLVFRSDDLEPHPDASVTVRWRDAHW
ncbi:phage tail protein [Streptomyces sp. NPDC126497]|uniref:phage distal tail protein n=1 Tax=Streptomyces sp. NPDC126497 TaxID=3155313 RepID=UPI0033314CEB